MSNIKESDIMERLSRVDELLKKSYLNQNIHESLNILQNILSNLDDSVINFKKLHMVLEKIILIFQKTDNRTRECILFLLKKYSNLFNNSIYDSLGKSNDDNICFDMRRIVIKILDTNDHTFKRQGLVLLKCLPFLIDSKIKDTILFFLTDKTLMEEEKKEIYDILGLKNNKIIDANKLN